MSTRKKLCCCYTPKYFRIQLRTVNALFSIHEYMSSTCRWTNINHKEGYINDLVSVTQDLKPVSVTDDEHKALCVSSLNDKSIRNGTTDKVYWLDFVINTANYENKSEDEIEQRELKKLVTSPSESVSESDCNFKVSERGQYCLRVQIFAT